MIFQGHNDGYHWIEWHDRSAFLEGLLENCPQFVLGKYLLNTTFDSGPLGLGPEEIENGWRSRGKYSVSPLIEDVNQVPICHYSEWYSFDTDFEVGNDGYKVFINFGGFSLEHESYAEQALLFWRQIDKIKPESYLAEGDNLICVTKRSDLYETIRGWKKAS